MKVADTARRETRSKTPLCAICWIDPETGRAGTNQTTRLCKKCKADPANVDWSESPVDKPASQQRYGFMSLDLAVREAVRDVIREEVRLIVREEIARARIAAPAVNDAQVYLSVVEAAKLIGVHPSTIREWIRLGRLAGHRAGRHHRVTRADLDACVASNYDTPEVDIDKRAAELAAA